jgi:predicted metallopeptidase
VIEKRDEQGRPIIDSALAGLVDEIGRLSLELARVDAKRVLFVAGAGRLMARASIRTFGAADSPSVVIDGEPRLYEISLRPRFFLETPLEERLTIVIHELWHASPLFDGTLAAERRHKNTAADAIDAEVKGIADRFRATGSRAGDFLSYVGELRMRAWRARPPSRIPANSSLRKSWDERDVFLAILHSADY